MNKIFLGVICSLVLRINGKPIIVFAGIVRMGIISTGYLSNLVLGKT